MSDGAIGELQRACLVVEQDGFQDLAEITIGFAIAFLDAEDVAVGGIGGDEALDEPAADVDGGIGVTGVGLGTVAVFCSSRVASEGVVGLGHVQSGGVVIEHVVAVAGSRGQTAAHGDVILTVFVG